MSEMELRHRAEERRRKDRERARLSTGLGMVLALLFGFAALRAPAPLTRAGWAVLSGWSLYFAWHVRRWLWPDDAPTGTPLEFYRRELLQRLDYGRNVWIRSGLPFAFLGLALVLVPALMPAGGNPRILLNAAPFFLLLAIWAVMFRRNRQRERDELRRELADLESLGR